MRLNTHDQISRWMTQFFIAGIATIIMFAGAWITHVVYCLETDRWGFLLAGAVFFPIGIIHGIGIWLGIW